MNKVPASLLSLLACLLLLGCAGSSSGGRQSLDRQLQEHDLQLRQIQPAQADVNNQVQSMRQELNAIKGLLDDIRLAGGAQAITDRLRRHDAALRQIETSMALSLNLGDPMPPRGAAPYVAPVVPTPLAPVPAPAAAPMAPDGLPTYGQPAFGQPTPTYGQPTYGQPTYGQPVPPGAVQPQSGDLQTQPGAMQAAPPAYNAAVPGGTLPYAGVPSSSVAPSAATWGQPSPQPQQPQQPKDIAQALYDSGENSLKARRYAEAQRSFDDFLQNYKTHPLASKAQFNLAECHFQQNAFADAALAYDTVIKKYPSSSSAPGAYLKQGICFSKMNQKAAAKTRMQELIKKFPNSPEAARAKNFLKTNN